MMSSRPLQLLLLGVILLSGYFAWQNMPRLGILPDAENRQLSGAQSGPASSGGKRLDLSGGEKRPFTRPQRDLFAALFPAPPPKPAPVVQPQPLPEMPVPIRVEPPPPPPPPVRTEARMPAFTVLGSLRKGGETTAFISVAGGIYLLKQDQVFAGEYRVAELSDHSITIVRDQDGGRVQLTLRDDEANKPLGADFGKPGPPRREPVPFIPPTPEPEAPTEPSPATSEAQPLNSTPAPRSFPFLLPANVPETPPQ